MLTNDELQRVARLVRLAPHMDQEQQQGLLKLIRELKAADSIGPMPSSAVQAMADAVPDQLVRDIVADMRHGPGEPGWIKREPSEPPKRGTGWASPPKAEDRSRQFAMYDAMVEHLVGGANDTSKLK